MDELNKIISKVFLLIIDILLFGYKIAKQVILPDRRKKGNILSSLFIFFIGIIDRLGSFEHGVFRMANLLRQKYIKNCLLIVTGFLFLLSSTEWTGDKNANIYSGNHTVQFSDAGVKKTTVSKRRHTVGHSAIICLVNEYPSYKNILHSSTPFLSSVKPYLLIRCIRI